MGVVRDKHNGKANDQKMPKVNQSMDQKPEQQTDQQPIATIMDLPTPLGQNVRVSTAKKDGRVTKFHLEICLCSALRSSFGSGALHGEVGSCFQIH